MYKRPAFPLYDSSRCHKSVVLAVERLRQLSPRPHLVVDPHGRSGGDVTDRSRVGIPGPFGNERVVTALPLNKAGGPPQLLPARVVHDQHQCYLADPDGNLIGDRDAVWVHRMLYARWTQDTRRLAV